MGKTPDPATGPIPRDEFARIVALPFGQAAPALRRFDPEWGADKIEPKPEEQQLELPNEELPL